jgi:hypothetical protein
LFLSSSTSDRSTPTYNRSHVGVAAVWTGAHALILLQPPARFHRLSTSHSVSCPSSDPRNMRFSVR